RLGERRTSKRSCTALASLLTFCPPGPEARMKCSSSSSSPMLMEGVMRIIADLPAGSQISAYALTSPPGLTTQVGSTRLAHLKRPKSGYTRFRGVHPLRKGPFSLRDGLHRNSGLPELRSMVRRKSGKPDLRGQAQQ